MKNKDIHILAIESSCDETAAAVVKNGKEVVSNVIHSQIDLHTLYGGVVPEIASRKHIEHITPVVQKALDDAKMQISDVDAIAVTHGPGLVGALLVGVSFAKALAFATQKPLIGVHHIEGHVCANYIENKDLKPPFLCLVVSGGHTNLALVKDYGRFEIVGKTRDDAAGEAFDKVARSIGLGYPGGPKIDKIAPSGDAYAMHFPKAKVHENRFDFSFSGVKSAVLNYQNQAKMRGESISPADLAASFQRVVVEVLVEHTIDAAKEYRIREIALAGGVAANSALRAAMKAACEAEGFSFYFPSLQYCTDNAAMIGSAAYFNFISGKRDDMRLNAVPGLRFGEMSVNV